MVGWHHRLNRHEFEQAPGDTEGQGSLMCCHSWDRKELNTTEQLNKQLALLGESGNPRGAHLLEFTSC